MSHRTRMCYSMRFMWVPYLYCIYVHIAYFIKLGNWKCQNRLSSNKDGAVQCAACETLNPALPGEFNSVWCLFTIIIGYCIYVHIAYLIRLANGNSRLSSSNKDGAVQCAACKNPNPALPVCESLLFY